MPALYVIYKCWKDMSEQSDQKKLSKVQRLLLILIPIGISLIFVIIYQVTTSHALKDYIYFGSISVIVNLAFIFILVFLNIDDFLEAYGGYAGVIIGNLTLIIPFFIYYIMISLVLAGFRFPFNY